MVWGLWLLVFLALWWTVGLRTFPVWTGLCVFLTAFLCFFFRDPDRKTPDAPDALISGADGVILGVQTLTEDQFLKTEAICISVFLGLWDVHVTRAPMAGVVRELGYFPGKAIPAYKETSSKVNRYSMLFIEGERTSCLVKQIVGMAARRAIHWPERGQGVEKGERIGMMKFGSRLDLTFPINDVTVLVEKGQRVVAGETVIARLKGASLQ
jgi:phosphatidylserine decarboxylase